MNNPMDPQDLLYTNSFVNSNILTESELVMKQKIIEIIKIVYQRIQI